MASSLSFLNIIDAKCFLFLYIGNIMFEILLRVACEKCKFKSERQLFVYWTLAKLREITSVRINHNCIMLVCCLVFGCYYMSFKPKKEKRREKERKGREGAGKGEREGGKGRGRERKRERKKLCIGRLLLFLLL